jgi:hypothetical protein
MRRTLDVTDGIEPTQLFPINRDVDKINSSKLGALPGKMSTFKSVDKGNSPFVEQLEGCQAPAELELKVGAQVMLLTVRITICASAELCLNLTSQFPAYNVHRILILSEVSSLVHEVE